MTYERFHEIWTTLVTNRAPTGADPIPMRGVSPRLEAALIAAANGDHSHFDDLPMNTKPPLINGKHYPLWQQFVDKQAQWIGGILEDHDMGCSDSTEITGITLVPNGDDSAYFTVDGKAFSCGFDVQYGGIGGGEEGWLTFHGYGGHTWRIKSL